MFETILVLVAFGLLITLSVKGFRASERTVNASERLRRDRDRQRAAAIEARTR